MTVEFKFSLDDNPGELARIADAFGDEGINIEGGAGIRVGGKGVITLVTSKADAARQVLEKANIPFKSEEVLVVKLKDKPGALAELTRAFEEKGINLTSFYITMAGQQVLGTDNIDAARKIAEKKGIIVD
jgi:hypothetical protein